MKIRKVNCENTESIRMNPYDLFRRPYSEDAQTGAQTGSAEGKR
ncbi:hypothetical protein AB6D20_028065 (plasmid) [Vibrio splendidus]